jgi:hypothetical protein
MIKLTLDTNCIINLLDFKAATPTSVDELSEIVRYALDGDINIAITTRVESDFEGDKDAERQADMVRKIRMFPVIGTVARFGTSTWGSGDFYAGEEHGKLEAELKALIFPGLNEKEAHYKNKVMDIDHLMGHISNQRDVFVTDDKEILRRADKLKASLGVIVMSPTQCLEYLDLRAKKDVLVQQVYEKVKSLKALLLQMIEDGYSEDLAKEYVEHREWLLRKFPKIQDGLLSFRHRMTSVPVGGQRVFNQSDIMSLQRIPQIFQALYKERTLSDKVTALFNNSYVSSPMPSDQKRRELGKQFDWAIDLLTSYVGYLEDN